MSMSRVRGLNLVPCSGRPWSYSARKGGHQTWRARGGQVPTPRQRRFRVRPASLLVFGLAFLGLGFGGVFGLLFLNGFGLAGLGQGNQALGHQNGDLLLAVERFALQVAHGMAAILALENAMGRRLLDQFHEFILSQGGAGPGSRVLGKPAILPLGGIRRNAGVGGGLLLG